MAKKIYIGNMIQDLQSSIADLQTDISTMSTDMANLVTTMAQQINRVVTKNGVSKEVVFANADSIHNTTTFKEAFSFMCRCDGFINIGVECKVSSTAGGVVAYSKNGATAVNFPGFQNAFTQADYQAYNAVVDVAAGDIISVQIKAYSSSPTVTLKAGSTVHYDLIDIINDGAVILK